MTVEDKRRLMEKKEPMKDAVLYVHGKGGSAAESEHYKTLFPDCKVTGLDYPSFTPWEAGAEIRAAAEAFHAQRVIFNDTLSPSQIRNLQKELELPVISEWDYDRLHVAPCRYSGSAYTDDLVICAHNYARHFSGIKGLHAGGKVRFTDVRGNEFLYEIADAEILEPAEVEEMVSGDWDLTLFTCTTGGQTRFALRCEKTGPRQGLGT